MAGISDIISRIYGSTHTPVLPTAPAPATPQAATDPTVAGPAVAPAVAQVAPAAAPQPSILGALSGLIAPQAGSFWSSAMQNGLAGAKQGQVNAQIAAQEKATKDAADAAKAKKASLIISPTGAVLAPNDDGTGVTVAYQPPTKPSSQQELYNLWSSLPSGSDARAFIERMAPNFQYTQPVIAAQGAARTATAVASQKAKTFAPKGGGSGVIKAPTGFFKVN